MLPASRLQRKHRVPGGSIEDTILEQSLAEQSRAKPSGAEPLYPSPRNGIRLRGVDIQILTSNLKLAPNEDQVHHSRIRVYNILMSYYRNSMTSLTLMLAQYLLNADS